MVAVRALVFGPQENTLNGPQYIAGRENHDRGGNDRQRVAEFPRGQRHKHLADKTAQAGQAQRGEENADGDSAIQRHPGEQPAELIQIAMMHPVVNHADQKEHAGRADAVGNHLEHGPVDPLCQ